MHDPRRFAELPELPGPPDEPDVLCPVCGQPESSECQESLCSPPCKDPHCADPRAEGSEFCRYHEIAYREAVRFVECEVSDDDWQSLEELAAQQGVQPANLDSIVDSWPADADPDALLAHVLGAPRANRRPGANPGRRGGPPMKTRLKTLMDDYNELRVAELEEMMSRSRVIVPKPSAREWLARWDAGEPVESVSMGGLSRGYEQAIQTTVAEILRWWIDHEPKDVVDSEALEAAFLSCSGAAVSPVADLHLSGAQWGAACSLARVLYDRGPEAFAADVAAGKLDACRLIKATREGIAL